MKHMVLFQLFISDLAFGIFNSSLLLASNYHSADPPNTPIAVKVTLTKLSGFPVLKRGKHHNQLEIEDHPPDI